jgi:hypothetical protein
LRSTYTSCARRCLSARFVFFTCHLRISLLTSWRRDYRHRSSWTSGTVYAFVRPTHWLRGAVKVPYINLPCIDRIVSYLFISCCRLIRSLIVPLVSKAL